MNERWQTEVKRKLVLAFIETRRDVLFELFGDDWKRYEPSIEGDQHVESFARKSQQAFEYGNRKQRQSDERD